MGAALSVISGLQIKLKYSNKNVEVHNFGCPRIGNPSLAQFITLKVDTVYRIIHNRDIVPHLPPEPLGYHHSAYEVFFDKGMLSYKICSEKGEDSTCSNKFSPEYNTADHDFYFIALSSLKC
jgi:hypothetical protein